RRLRRQLLREPIINGPACNRLRRAGPGSCGRLKRNCPRPRHSFKRLRNNVMLNNMRLSRQQSAGKKPAQHDKRGGRRGSDTMLPLVILGVGIVAAIIEPKFASVDNLMNLARQMMPLLIMAVGQAFAIISGGLDLSLAAVMSLAGVLGVLTMAEYGAAAG